MLTRLMILKRLHFTAHCALFNLVCVTDMIVKCLMTGLLANAGKITFSLRFIFSPILAKVSDYVLIYSSLLCIKLLNYTSAEKRSRTTSQCI